MGLYDRPSIAVEKELVQVSGGGTFPNSTNIWGNDDEDAPAVGQDDAQLVDDRTGEEVPNPSLRLDAPTTPLHLLEAPSTPASPRESPTQSQKRRKVESAKKVRLSMLTEERNAMIRVVKFAGGILHDGQL